jgi:hypothetical protein
MTLRFKAAGLRELRFLLWRVVLFCFEWVNPGEGVGWWEPTAHSDDHGRRCRFVVVIFMNVLREHYCLSKKATASRCGGLCFL